MNLQQVLDLKKQFVGGLVRQDCCEKIFQLVRSQQFPNYFIFGIKPQ